MHPQTACQLGPAVITYRFHPFFQRHVTVLRRLRRGETSSVIVRIEPLEQDERSEEQLCINVPCWMLDPIACARIVCEQKAQIEFKALLSLRTLLDHLDLVPCKSCGKSDSMIAKGNRHEQPNSDQAPANKAVGGTTET